MKRCSECGEVFRFKDRLKACFTKHNTLTCNKCLSTFSHSQLNSKLSFYIPFILYVLLFIPINNQLKIIFTSRIIIAMIELIIAFIFILFFVFISQFIFKYRKD